MTEVDEHVRASLIKTHGNLYRGARLTRYPIPPFPLPAGEGRQLLDVGCNWGRWSIAAARAGWRPTGVDLAKKSVGAARRVAGQLGVEAEYVVGDARELPFADGSFDAVFSYSVLQHLAKEDVPQVVSELDRVLRPAGFVWIEMPNAYGPLNLVRSRQGHPFALEAIARPEVLPLPGHESRAPQRAVGDDRRRHK